MTFASSVAEAQGLNKDHFLATLKCESRFDWKAVGDGGHSIGVAQIHANSHPDITYEQMLDPYWSILWMAKEWRNDRAWQWTCWRIKYQ